MIWLFLSILSLSCLAFLLGIFSIIKNGKSKIVHKWFFLSMVIGLWGIFLSILITKNTVEDGIFYSKLIHLMSSFIPILFFDFVCSFLLVDFHRINLILKRLGYLFAITFAVLSFTGFIVAGASPKLGFNIWVDAGYLYSVYLLYFWVYIVASLVLLLKALKRSTGFVKRKVKFVLIATIILAVGGGSNFLPQTVGVYPYGNFIAWTYPIFVFYGIFVDEIKIKISLN